MISGVDFSTPIWLVNYYHGIGSVSLVFNSYALFLVLFKSSKLDSFKYYLLAFQFSNLLVDFDLTFLMQPQPLHPIPAGFCTGFLAQGNFVPSHYLMVFMSGLMAVQFSALTLCFFRKFISIKKIEREEVALWLKVVIVGTMLVIILFIMVAFSLCKKSDEEEFKMIQRDYPEYEKAFRSLDNFAIYALDGYWMLMLVDVVLCVFWFGGIIFFCTKRIYEILGKFKSSMSAGTYRKHRQAIMSLVAQLVTSLFAMIPPMSLCVLLIFEFKYAQVTSRLFLMIFSAHASVNAVVIVLTTPPFREYTKFWKRGKGTPVVVSTAPSGNL